MREYVGAKPLIAIHVPKCGGTSFTAVLHCWYGDKCKLHYFDGKNDKLPDKHRLEPGICIHGHFNKLRGFGIEEYYPQVDQFITILRDPLEICISNYFYNKKMEKEGARYYNGALYNSNETLEEYVKEYRSHILHHMPCDMTLDNYIDIIHDKFIYIGISEDMQRCVDTLSDKLGFSRYVIGHENVSERNDTIKKEIADDFISRNELEYKIYEYVKNNYLNW